MPGLHIFFGRPHVPQTTSDSALQVKELLHFPDYVCQTHWAEPSAVVASTGSPSYPVFVFTHHPFDIVLEGHFYGRNPRSVLSDLCGILGRVVPARTRDELLRQWLLGQDGDFVVVMRNNSDGTYLVVNDVLGRLPLYYFEADGTVCLTREIRLVSVVNRQAQVDRHAACQMLLFGFPLGERTVFESVDRLPGGTAVSFDPAEGVIRRQVLHTYGFDASVSERTPVPDLAELFTAACLHRARPFAMRTLGLSGGHDSRTVAAGLARGQSIIQAYTWTGWQQGEDAETRAAKATAQALNLDWKTVATAPPRATDAARIVSLKGGLVYTATAFGVPFLEYLRAAHGSGQVYFSGDGGDKVLPRLLPFKRLASTEDLIRFLLARDALIDTGVAARLCRLPEAEVIAEIASVVEAYPETRPGDRYVHFQIYERAMKWLFEGEDRNRSYFWCCTPFYALPFFTRAMAFPQEAKGYHRFYRAFLRALNPAVAKIPDANRGLAIDSPWYGLRMRAVAALQRNPQLLGSVKRLLRRQSPAGPFDSAIAMVLRQQAETCPDIAETFDLDFFHRHICDGGVWNPPQQHQFLTLVSAVQLHRLGRTSLLDFPEATMP